MFRKHEDYDTKGLAISDDAIRKFVDFLFSYNFTLEENTLYDEELELNPEFLGIIFEKLVNKEYGAIYTPRLEVDFMCRLALIKYLQNNLPNISLENLYKLFFPEYGDESDQTVGDFTRSEAEELLQKLETVTVCDPAIGSGAFAVGMLNVIDEIECSIYANFLPDTPIDTPTNARNASSSNPSTAWKCSSGPSGSHNCGSGSHCSSKLKIASNTATSRCCHPSILRSSRVTPSFKCWAIASSPSREKVPSQQK